MSRLRVAVRAPAFAAVTVVAALAVVLARVLSKPFPRGWRRVRQRVFSSWASVTARILGVRLDVRGVAPEPPFLLISNHLGYLDILLYAATVDAVFVSKREVAHWPFFGPLVRLLDTIFIDREKRSDVVRANALIDAALERGEGVIVFAEGTSSDGRRVLPLKPSLLRAAETNRAPLHYARLAYETDPDQPDAADAVCWWGDMPFITHVVGLFKLRRVSALVHFGPERVSGNDRKMLARALHERIERLPIAGS